MPEISASRALYATPDVRGEACAAHARLAISATLICKNEAGCIGKCLASLRDFAEIVVVDSGSTDATLAIVEDFTMRGWPIRLFRTGWRGYAAQKQFAWDQATQPWVFNIDADEWLDDALRAALPRLLVADREVVGWLVRRLPALYGRTKPLPAWIRPEAILRIVRREAGRYDENCAVHETLLVEGPTKLARHGVLHHDRALPFHEQIQKEIRYASLKARQRCMNGRPPKPLNIVGSPAVSFLRLLFVDRFILCGWPGVIRAATGAIYSMMTEIIHYQTAHAPSGDA